MCNGSMGRVWVIAWLMLGALAPLSAQAQQPEALDAPRDILSDWQSAATEQALVGSWTAKVGSTTRTLTFNNDGAFTLGGREGRYTVTPDTLTLSRDGRDDTYAWKLTADNTLELSGGDLNAPLTFTPRPQAPGYLARLFDVSPATLWYRAGRVLFILAVVLAARAIIALVRWVSQTLIFAEWGPLGLVYRSRKNRSRTVHSLVLNVLKYFIYFTAAGMILAELGINYTTYVASLSVVGLAIGFGSQSLVQDVVTGFFILFEEQFDVGDMVEIGGQTGVVQEIGLRSTKVRNYLGQVVVIPNRNITTVANYSRGAQRAYLDVFIERPDAAQNAMPLLDRIGNELMRQYPGVVLGPIRTTGPVTLATGETYIRLHLSIWPGQTWVIDSQLVPRTRERFAEASLKIPTDRVTVFYHAREHVPVTSPFFENFPERIRERIPFFRRRSQPEPPTTTPPPHGA